MNLKALKEKRNTLLNELETMVSSLENNGEVRALSVEERTAFEGKKVEIDNIDATIKMVEETRAKAISEEAVVELNETRSKEEAEIRAVENFFRGMDLQVEERKVLASTSSNQALMPLEISKSIMKRLEELVPVLEMAKRFGSKGTLRLLKEDSYGQAGITPEDSNFKDTDVTFATVELRNFKVSAMVQATFEMLSNVEIDLSNYLLDVITRRLAKELNRLFIMGTGINQPQGLVHGVEKEEINAELTVSDFINLQTHMNPAYLDKACWIVNRKTFQVMANMLDNLGRPFMTSNVIGEKIQYTILGVPVVVDENMENLEAGKKAVILVNVGEAYAINILTDITVRHLTEVGFTQGFEVYAGYVMADGKIINEDAMVIGEVASVGVTKAKK